MMPWNKSYIIALEINKVQAYNEQAWTLFYIKILNICLTNLDMYYILKYNENILKYME